MNDETIFAVALEKQTPAERAAYLAEVCATDPDQRRRIDGLLAAHDRAAGFLERPAVGPNDPDQTQTHGGADGEPAEELAFLESPGRPDSLGRLGHYEVLELLGRGGFGIVFRAFDDALQRVVAVKVLAPSMAVTSPARKRFLREARSAAIVRHENVVQVHDVKEQPLPYLVMEYIPGESLQQRLDRSGPLEVPEVLRIGREIAEGLAAAHEQGLIHRDIKPSNILIDEGPQERVKITDFGLARAADDASLTRSGTVAGTPMYMAPEQANGETLDHRADLFSLGSVLYCLLTGHPPFRASSTPAVLKRVAEDDPRPIREIIPEVPEWLCRIVARLHAKDPGERFQSAKEVAEILADCQAQLIAHSELRDESRIPRRRRRAWRPSASLLVPVLLMVIAATITGWYVVQQYNRQLDLPRLAGEARAKSGTPVEKAEEGWVPLFNGTDLAGWKEFPAGRNSWRVEDGILVGSGKPSHLFSERGDFANFHLRVEMRLKRVDGGGAVGVFSRIPLGDPGVILSPYGDGQLYTVPVPKLYDENATPPDPAPPNYREKPLVVWGADAEGKSTWTQPVPADEWFTHEFILDGVHATLKAGTPDRSYTGYKAATADSMTGHLALQLFDDRSVVEIRKIEIKELPPSRSDPAVGPLRDLVAAKERSLGTVRVRFEAGRVTALAVIAAEIDLLDARVRLAEAEQDRESVVTLLREVVAKRREERARTESLVKAGVERPGVLDQLDAKVADAEARLAATDDDWEPLFNGEDLTGWEGDADVWSRVGGQIHGDTSHRPAAPFTESLVLWSTRRTYGDFELRFGVDLSTVAGDARVIVRERAEAGLTVEHVGSFAPRFARRPAGNPEQLKQALKSGFNEVSIRCVGKRVTVRVNGVITIDQEFEEILDDGRLGFGVTRSESVRSRVVIRDVRIRELPRKTTPEERRQRVLGRLRGEWPVVFGETGNVRIPEDNIAGMEIHFRDNEFELLRTDNGPERRKGTYEIKADLTQLLLKLDGARHPVPCSYQFVGDGLELRFPEPRDIESGNTLPFVPEDRTASVLNLRTIGIALHRFLDEHDGRFPPASITAKEAPGKPLLSWRVALLPYLGQEELYHQFKLDEPWDSEHNKTLIDKMPKAFAAPGVPTERPGLTHYRVFVGPGMAFEPQADPSQGVKIVGLTDGTSHTILVIEAAEPVIWTRPLGLPYDPDKPLPKLGIYDGGAHALMGDGSVTRVSTPVSDEGLHEIVVRDAIERTDGVITGSAFIQSVPGWGPELYLQLRRRDPPAEPTDSKDH